MTPRVLAVLGDRPDQLDRLGDPLDGDLAAQLDLTVEANLGGGGVKGDLRMALGVEELRRLQMTVAVLLAGVDAGGLDRALQHGSLSGDINLALEGAKAPTD